MGPRRFLSTQSFRLSCICCFLYFWFAALEPVFAPAAAFRVFVGASSHGRGESSRN